MWKSLAFYAVHLVPIVGIVLIAAVGRVIQLGWGERIPSAGYWALESVVEGARLLLLLLVLRYSLSAMPVDSEQFFESLWQNLAKRWVSVCASIIVFAVFALLINTGINLLAQQEGG